jgi:hypothetical protein
MKDRRELILQRLLALAEGVEGVVLAARNRLDLSDHQRPAIVILDSDEVVDAGGSGQGRPAKASAIVSMTPEILILLQDDYDRTGAAGVGAALNTMRVRVLRAVLADPALQALTGPNGAIRYEGCATGLSRGRNMEGEMGLSIAFEYPLIHSDLLPPPDPEPEP